MNGLYEPFGRQLSSHALLFRPLVNQRADGRELHAEPEIIDEAGNFFGAFSAPGIAADDCAELRKPPPRFAGFFLDGSEARADLGYVFLEAQDVVIGFRHLRVDDSIVASRQRVRLELGLPDACDMNAGP